MSCRRDSELDNLLYFNLIKWDLKDLPDYATVNNQNIYHTEYIDQVWCTSKIKLLLPVNKIVPQNKINIYYQVEINKANITFRDIIHTIYKFYHGTKISFDDLKYIALADTNKESTPYNIQLYKENKELYSKLRFISFLQDQTHMIGLKSQTKNTFALHIS